MTLYASPGRDLSNKPVHTLHGTWLAVAVAIDSGERRPRALIEYLRRPDESRTTAKKRVGQAIGALMKIDFIRTGANGLELTDRGASKLAKALANV